MNVSEQLLDILANEGVKHIFGVTGDALNPLVTAIGHRDDIDWVRMHHEGNASYAAFAQGELSGNLGVCAGTVGPGALHLINGLYNAKKERSPVLAITGQVPVEFIGTNYHQEVNLEKIYDDVCEYQAIVRSAEEAPRVILKAIRIAINQKCVCRIELPGDIAAMPAANVDFMYKVFRSDSETIPNEQSLMKVAHAINSAKRIGILAGAGCRDAREEVLELAAKLKAPICHTLRASDVFDHDTPQVVGLTGLIGNPSGYAAVMKSDLLIMLGTDFPYSKFLPEQTKTIQIDIRADNIGNRTPVDIGLHGNLKPILQKLTPLCEVKKDDRFLSKLQQSFDHWKKDMHASADPKRNMQPLHPQIFAKTLSDEASDDAIFAIDTGTSAIWASNFMSFHSDRRILGSFNHGSMAVGLPATIGAQFQFPNREVWGLVGDGAFNMTLNDFSTAVTYNLPIKLIVFNNAELGFVKIEMEEQGLAPNFDALKTDSINFSEYAKLCGGDGIRVEKAEDIKSAILQAKSSNKPFIIEAMVSSGELSLPPRIGAEQIAGFGLSKVKEMWYALRGDKSQFENLKKELEAILD